MYGASQRYTESVSWVVVKMLHGLLPLSTLPVRINYTLAFRSRTKSRRSSVYYAHRGGRGGGRLGNVMKYFEVLSFYPTGRLGERDLAHEGVRLCRVRESVHRNVAPWPSGHLVSAKPTHDYFRSAAAMDVDRRRD